MRLIRLIGLVSLLSVAAFGQRGGFRGGFGGGFRGGFGGFRGGFIGGGFGGFRGGFIGGGFRTFPSRFFFPSHRFFSTRFFFNRPFFSPGFGYPFFDGGFYYSAPYDYAPQPNTVVIYPPPAAGPEYISQPAYVPETARPEMREYGRKPIYFSLARRDGTVEDVAAFWIEGGTLHYIDLEGRSRSMPFSEIDRARSEKLNRYRGVELQLPQSPR